MGPMVSMRVGRRHHAARAHAAVRGLEADHAAERAGDADRASVVAADRGEAEAGRDGGRRSRRRSAGDPVEIPGIVRRTEAAGCAGAGEGHFIQIQFAEEDRARGFQARGRLPRLR